jgi:hypothetical protein
MDPCERAAIERRLVALETELERLPRTDPFYTGRRNRIRDQIEELKETLHRSPPATVCSQQRA